MQYTRIIITLILLSFKASIVGASNFFDEPLSSDVSIPSVVTVELGTDAVGSQDVNFYVDNSLQSENRLQLGFGSTSYDAQIGDSTSYSLGFTGNPLDELSFGFRYDFLEREESILLFNVVSRFFSVVKLRMRIDSVLAFVTWQQDDWSVSFKPKISNILLEPSEIVVDRDQYIRGIRSPGFDLSISYLGLDNFSLSASHAEINYSNNIALLKSIALRSGQFDESRTSASIDYNGYDWGSVGLEWQRNEAIDNIDVYDVTIVNVFLALSENWSVQGQIGSPSGGSINTEGFGSLALSYSW